MQAPKTRAKAASAARGASPKVMTKAKAASGKSAAPAKAASRKAARPGSGGTRAMLDDIRTRGEKLTADINALLHRLA